MTTAGTEGTWTKFLFFGNGNIELGTQKRNYQPLIFPNF